MIDENRRAIAGGRHGLDAEAAEAVAVEGLGFLASDPRLLQRFLQLSGLEADELRRAAADRAFFAGLLDFILADERTLAAFADHAGIAPDRVAQARRALAGVFGDVPQ